MIEFVPETGSTNSDLIARLRAGEAVAEGCWLVADRQTAGRGRMGREWASAPGNFTGSTVVRLGPGGTSRPGLALAAGLALYAVVLPLLADPGGLSLKWPNDLLLRGAKLAGILLEREGDAVVVGMGVNLAWAPRIPGHQTIALGQCVPLPDRDAFARQLERCFAGELARWRSQDIDALTVRWLAVAHPEGTPLCVHDPRGQRISGVFAGLEADGALRLRLADGALRVIHAGDVMLESG